MCHERRRDDYRRALTSSSESCHEVADFKTILYSRTAPAQPLLHLDTTTFGQRMKIEPIRSFPKLKGVSWPDLVCCPELDRVVAVHSNSRQILVCEFMTGVLLHTERCERHAVISKFHLEGRWLFLDYYGPSFSGMAVFDILNCQMLSFDERLIYRQYLGTSKRYAFLGGHWTLNHNWYLFNLQEGTTQLAGLGLPSGTSFSHLGPCLAGIYDQVSETKRSVAFFRMDDQGLPGSELVGTRDDGMVIHESGGRLYFLPNHASENFHIECFDESCRSLFQMSYPSIATDGKPYRVGLMVEEGNTSGIGVVFRERNQSDAQNCFVQITKFWITGFDIQSGANLWETSIQHFDFWRAFIAGGNIVVSDPEGFQIVDLRSGRCERVLLQHIHCASGNGNYLTFTSRTRAGYVAAPHNPYFFWQPAEKAPLVMGRIVE